MPEVSADLKKLVEKWVKKRFGIPGIVALAVLLVLGGLWWKWDEVVKVPGIAELVKLASRERLPNADPNTFSIAVAHLEGDTAFEKEKIMVAALSDFVSKHPSSGAKHTGSTV
jgi:hypothetical protein